MDHSLFQVTEPTAATPPSLEGVRCEQVVFTSVRTPMGAGYRVVAAGSGVTPEEKTEITRRSPSHGGLCRSDDQATAFSFYPAGQRLCVAWSRPAGREPSGRGGLRIFTRALLLEPAAFDAFAFNPFNVLRAMEITGAAEPELKPPPVLPPVELSAYCQPATATVQAALARVGADWLSQALEAVIAGQPLIVAGEEDSRELVEAVLLGLPVPLRRRVSFACGLKFSIGRGFALSGVSGDVSGIERIIRGQPLVLVRPDAAAVLPASGDHAWCRMVADYWSASSVGQLETFTAQPFSDCSPAALEMIGTLQTARRRAATADTGELLALAGRWLSRSLTGEPESHLVADLLETVRARLDNLWARVSPWELTTDWPLIVKFLRNSPEALAFAAPLLGRLLGRLAEAMPPQAVGCALEIAGPDTARVLRPTLVKLLETVEHRFGELNAAERQQLSRLLEHWAGTYPHIPLPDPLRERAAATP